MTFIAGSPRQISSSASVLDLLTATAHHGDLVALVAGRAQIVERKRVLGVAAGEMARFDPHPGDRVVGATAFSGCLGTRGVDGAFLYVVDEHHPVRHSLTHDGPAHE